MQSAATRFRRSFISSPLKLVSLRSALGGKSSVLRGTLSYRGNCAAHDLVYTQPPKFGARSPRIAFDAITAAAIRAAAHAVRANRFGSDSQLQRRVRQSGVLANLVGAVAAGLQYGGKPLRAGAVVLLNGEHADRCFRPLTVQVGGHGLFERLITAMITQHYYVLKAVQFHAARGILQRFFETFIRHGDRARIAHVRCRGVEGAFRHIGNDGRNDRVAQSLRDHAGQNFHANIMLAQSNVRAALLRAADRNYDRGFSGVYRIAELRPSEFFEISTGLRTRHGGMNRMNR